MQSKASWGPIVAGSSKIGLVGGDQRQSAPESEIEQLRFDTLLHSQSMALQFDIEAIRKELRKIVQTRFGEVGTPGCKTAIQGSARTAGQENEPVAVALQLGFRDMRQSPNAGSSHAAEARYIRLR